MRLEPGEHGPHGTVVVYITPGTPISGIWCPNCLLPARVSESPLNSAGWDGVSTIAQYETCTECEQ